jgi:hypothetical protein
MNLFWEIIAFFKWQSIKNNTKILDELYKDICFREKKIKKKEKENLNIRLNSCVKSCDSYLDFCEKRNIPAKIDTDEYHAKLDDINEALQYENPLDFQLNKATKEYNKAYELLNSKGASLLECRNKSLQNIENTEKIVNSIAKTPKEFEKEIKEIKIIKEKFKSALEYGKEQTKNLKKAAIGSGAGVGVGVAAASMAPTAAMWVATTFGTASTGTAISALSGAAATNAALAWLGGGALASGGAGMAAGQALLALAGPVGWGIAGASIFASAALFIYSKFNANAKKKKEIETIMNSTNSLRILTVQIESLTVKTNELSKKLSDLQKKTEYLNGCDYTNLSEEEKYLLGTLINNTKSLSKLISKVVGEDDVQ